METLKANCPQCTGVRRCEVHGVVDRSWEVAVDDYNSVDGSERHRLLQCQGCETVFYMVESRNSEEWEGRINRITGQEEIYHPLTVRVYPPPDSAVLKPAWVASLATKDWQLYSIVDQIYEARESQLLILAAVGIRTAFDRATELLGVDAAITLADKVSELESNGFVGAKEAELLATIIEAGNAAAHRGWSPDISEFGTLLAWLEQFLTRCFVKPGSPDSIKGIPARVKKSK